MSKTLRTIRFTINGRPQQRGSKTPWIPRHKDGSMLMKNGKPVIATMDSNKKSKSWMGQVRDAAAASFEGELLRGPIRMTCWFYFQRPASHFGSGRNSGKLKTSAPEYFTQAPDLDKLIRLIGDSLTGVVLADDKQICALGNETGKFWTVSGECAEVMIEELDG